MNKTFAVKFFKRSIFNLAINILDDELGRDVMDIGHSDMIVTFFDESIFMSALGALSLLKDDADFEVIKD